LVVTCTPLEASSHRIHTYTIALTRSVRKTTVTPVTSFSLIGCWSWYVNIRKCHTGTGNTCEHMSKAGARCRNYYLLST